ncbi:coiled-coil domain-containing protein 125 isoform X2 [Hypomesus transpacificus]|uniref:coiled-coil domain-containing protein 125 isoform X2 n=1 Tax=Hypomesus transpacificus TaxID=137520 RepID=UPI001F079FC5|nr:coiled-coil domain-containing protein 125 isoform X2 [Hypomesus transpacificus]
MQGAEGAEAPGGGTVEDDMAEGDLGDGGGLRSEATSRTTRPSRGSVEEQLPRSGLRRGDSQGSEAAFTWTSCRSLNTTFKEELEGCQASLFWRDTGRDTEPLSDLSSEQLRHKVQDLSEEVALLRCELEVKHRHLEGKQEALKILQGQAILDKATSHSRRLQLKSEERTKALEKEVNVLQWEIMFNQDQFKNCAQSWDHKHNRVCSENQALSDSLAQRGAELQALRSENYTLSQQCLELVATLGVREQRAIQGTRLLCGQAGEADTLESAVLGACLCRAEREPCPCARTAKKHLLQLTQEVESQSRRREEAVMVADAFRIAFEQQLQRRSDHFLLLADTDRKFHSHKTEGGVSKSNSSGVGQRLRALLPSSAEGRRLHPPIDTLHSLLDKLNDKEEALAHQRKVILMLAHNADKLERRLQNPPHQDTRHCADSGQHILNHAQDPCQGTTSDSNLQHDFRGQDSTKHILESGLDTGGPISREGGSG